MPAETLCCEHTGLWTVRARFVNYRWALIHKPAGLHKNSDDLGFNFTKVVYTNHTLARVKELRGMKRAWAKDNETYHDDVNRPKI
jgi:hypothetical protein